MCVLFKGLWCSRLPHLADSCSIKHYTGSDRSLCLSVGDFFQTCDEINLDTSEEVSTTGQCRRTYVWFSWQNNSSISSIPRLAADVQACEEILVILGGGVADLCSGFLELMCWTPSACYDVYWVIHCLCSIQQTLSGESLEVLLANLLIIHHGLHGRRTCNVLWIMYD